MGNPVRILHVVYILNRGGMESRLIDLFRELDKSRFQFDFYVESGKHGAYEEEVERLGGRIFYPNKKEKHRIPCLTAWRQFLIAHKEYQIIYAYNQWAGWYLREAKRCGVPHRIASSRTSLQTFSLKNLYKNLVKQNINHYATDRFAVSKKAAIWLFGKRMVEEQMVNIWPNAIDTERYRFSQATRDSVRNELGLTDELVVIHIGNLRFEKNHPFLLEVFAKLRESYQNAQLILVGGGKIDILQARIDSLGIHDSIHYLGIRSDVSRLLQAGDLFIFPSLYEGFPGAVLEAEASGLRCLISNSITEEIDLTNHIRRLPLSAGAARWAEEVERIPYCERSKACEEIRAAGYDVRDLVLRTEAFFQQCEKQKEVEK